MAGAQKSCGVCVEASRDGQSRFNGKARDDRRAEQVRLRAWRLVNGQCAEIGISADVQLGEKEDRQAHRRVL